MEVTIDPNRYAFVGEKQRGVLQEALDGVVIMKKIFKSRKVLMAWKNTLIKYQ
jgi:hypothetical protein